MTPKVNTVFCHTYQWCRPVLKLLLVLHYIKSAKSSVHLGHFHGLSGCTKGWIMSKDAFYSCTTISTVECLTICNRVTGCYSVAVCEFGQKFTCSLLDDIPTGGCAGLTEAVTCRHLQHGNAQALMLANPCKNGGTYDMSVCYCVAGYAGTWCERYVKSCSEAYQLGVRGKGFYKIQPAASPEAYTVYCNCEWGGTIYAMKRPVNTPSYCQPISFNRTWDEYKNGFGNIDCGYFLGLETMHKLTGYSNYQWNFYNVLSDYQYDASMYLEHAVLNSESQRYEIEFVREWRRPEQYGDEAFNENIQPRDFCTWDQDCNGCAKSEGGGWWYISDCSGGAMTASPSKMVWPVDGIDRVIETTFLQMDDHGVF